MLKAPWFSSIYKALIYSALVLTALYWMTTGGTSFGALVAALIAYALGLLMILILTINNIQGGAGGGAMGFMGALGRQTGPLMLVVGFIGYILYLVFTYQGVISAGEVAPAYGTFMGLSLALIFVNIVVMMQNQTAEGYIYMNSITSNVLYLINLLLFICVNIVGNTLRYFTTDGFFGGLGFY